MPAIGSLNSNPSDLLFISLRKYVREIVSLLQRGIAYNWNILSWDCREILFCI